MDERIDPRPVWLALAAWGGAWAATSGVREWWLAGAVLVLVLGAVAAARRSWAAVGAVLILTTALGGGILRLESLATDPLIALARQGAIVEVDAVLRGGARTYSATGTRPESWVQGATLVGVRGRGEGWTSGAPIELSATGETVSSWRRVPLGSTVRVTVKLSAPDPDENLVALARAREPPRIVVPPGAVDAAVQKLRDGLRAASDGLMPDARMLVPALVVGDTGLMSQELEARFKVTGLTHLTAVSGANLVLLLGFIRAVAVRCGVRGRSLTILLAFGVAAFVVLCLGEPSVVRAAAMGLVGLVALGSAGRGRQGVRYLASAVLFLMLWDPWLSRSLGFVLSVAASAGLLWWAGRWTQVLGRWLPHWAAESVAVPLAAQLATQPVVTAISGQVSLAGLLANAVAGPLVGPATVCGFLAAGLSVVFLPAACAFAWLAGWCAQGLCWIARLGDALPGASITWPTSPPAVILVGCVSLLVAQLVPHLFARRWLTITCAVAMVATLLRTPSPPGWPPEEWSIVSCDVGQGDATLLRAAPGVGVLVDAGPDPALLRRCLDQLGIREVPLVVLTHLHADHANGLPALAGRGVRQVVTSGVLTPASGERLVEDLESTGSEHVTARTGSAWTASSVRVDVLDAPSSAAETGPGEGESSGENDASLLIRVSVDGISLLLAGDAEIMGQERRMGHQAECDIDVLLVPHHGSARQSQAFIAASSPEIALISVAAKNDYGHPAKKTLKMLGGLTPNILRTDEHGSIALAAAAGRIAVTTQR